MHKLAIPTVLSILLFAATAVAQDPVDPPVEPTIRESLISKLKPQAQAVAIDSQGRIVLLGGSKGSSKNKPVKLARLLPSGLRDDSFGGSGVVKANFKDDYFSGETFVHDALAVDPEDRVYATVEPQENDDPVGVIRFLTDGALDPEWGSGGVVWLNFGAEMHLTAVALESDGSLVLGLSEAQEDGDEDGVPTEIASVAHLSSDGVLDEAYGKDGLVRLPEGDRVDDVEIDSTGRAVVSTLNARGNGRQAPIYRLLPDGQLDPEFGEAGEADAFDDSFDQEIALDEEDRVLVSTTDGKSGSHIHVLRLGIDGTIDEEFGEDGLAFENLEGRVGADNPIAVDDDGRIVVGTNVRSDRSGDGRGNDRRSTDFALLRFEADGKKLDSTFGEEGLMQIDFRGQKDRLAALAMGLDGSIVVSGGARVPGKRGMKGAVVVVPPDAAGGE